MNEQDYNCLGIKHSCTYLGHMDRSEHDRIVADLRAKLIECLENYTFMVKQEYCSHPNECGADNEKCYGQNQYILLRQIRGENEVGGK